MSTIALHGFYGQGNLGDEAILTAFLREFGRFPNVEAVVFSTRPDEVSRAHNVKSVSSTGIGSAMGRRMQIGASDLFVLGGGALLKDFGPDSSSLEGWLKLLRQAKGRKKKTALGAVGVENIRYDESKVALRDALAGVDLLAVRDEHSKQVLQDIGVENEVRVASDPSVLLARPRTRTAADGLEAPSIIVNVRHWFAKGWQIEDEQLNERFIEALGGALDDIVARHSAKIEFVPLRIEVRDDDRAAAEQVMSHVTQKRNVSIRPTVPTVGEFIGMLNRCSMVVGMRLHALILASAVGVPVVGLEYAPKVGAYLDSIHQRDFAVDLTKVTRDQLVAAVDDTLGNYDDRCKATLRAVSELQSLARNCITDLVKLAG